MHGCTFFTGTLSTRSHSSEREGSVKLTPEQLKLKEIEVPVSFNARVIKVLEGCNIKYQLQRNQLLVEPSVYGEHESTEYKITTDREIRKIIPRHCLLSFKYSQDNRMTPILLESHRFDENIIDGVISHSLPTAYLSVSTKEHEYTCMHIAENQIALTSLSKPEQPRFLTITYLGDCHAVVFWDQNTQTAIMSHFMQNDMCEASFDFMLSKITQYAPMKDIKAFIVGGIVKRMKDSGNFFEFAEQYLDKKTSPSNKLFWAMKKTQ